MGKYSLRDGEVRAPKMSAKHLKIENVDNEGDFVAPYIKLQSVAKGVAPAYLYIGTAGAVMVSSTAPVGTTGNFVNVGGQIGTTA